MDLKIYSRIALSILVFALIAGIATTFENVYAQGEDENTGVTTNGTTGRDTGEATDETDGGDTGEATDETDGGDTGEATDETDGGDNEESKDEDE